MRKFYALKPATLVVGFLLFFLSSFAQPRVVTGVVLDQEGKPVPGATVTVKGTTTATQTDADGNYRISVGDNATLVITSVGFGAREIAVGNQTSVTVALTSSNTSLSEVVVVGYGTSRRKDLTGSVASVSAKDFNKGVVVAPDQLIQGKVAGVQVINNSGQPGGAATVRIRGVSSIRSGTQPLYIIDGVPLPNNDARPGTNTGFGSSPGANPLNFLNPNDIASIDVLKDASATAIYGSRGANGVILITTKKGQSGQPSLELNTSNGFSNVMKRLDVLTGDEYRAAMRQYNITSGDFKGSSDPFGEITRTAYVQNHNFAVSGGTEMARYRFSGGYQNQGGVVRNSDLKKYTGNFTGTFYFLDNKRLGLDVNLLGSGIAENIAPVTEDAGFQGSVIGQALQYNPTHPLRRPDGSIWVKDDQLGATTVNPLALLEAYRDKVLTSTILASISPSFKITNGLEYRMLVSINKGVGNRRSMLNRFINIQNVEGRGQASVANAELTNHQITQTLNFNRQVSSALYLSAVGGYEYLKSNSRGFGVSAQDFPDNIDLNYTNLLQYSTQGTRQIGSGEAPASELQSFFVRGQANFRDRYVVSAIVRADGSSKFGKNNRYGVFPSFGLAWNVTNEDFLKDNGLFDQLKLRVGYGEVGNQDFPSGASLNRFVFGQQSVSRSNFGNEDLRWENSKTTNLGIDFSVLKDRLSGTVEYFYKKTTDPLYERTVAAPGPAARVWVNLPGFIENKGFELALNAGIIREKNINWNFGVNAAFLQNRVNGLGQFEFYETGALHGQGISGATSQRIVNNQPINAFYLPRFQGISKTTGQSEYEGGDPSINKFYVGSPNPTAILGLSTDFNYKKLTATINMNGAFGHFIYNNTATTVLPIGNLGTRNIAANLVNTGVKEDLSNPVAASTRYLEKGDYLKMANATLSYRLGNIGRTFKNVNLSVTGQNLFVITKYSGFDPEVNTNKSVNGVPSFGIEYTPYPSARTVLFGVNFSL